MERDEILSALEHPGLTFEDGHHVYRLHGDVIPSVSTVLEPLSGELYAGIGKKTLDRAAEKGSEVHFAIEIWIKYGADEISEEHRGYFEAFLKWWEATKPIVIGSEVRTYHKILRYGGTIDLLCIIDGKLTLVDFKCTAAFNEMTCGVQLEAYSQALKSHGINVENKLILHLKKDGNYAVHPFLTNDVKRWRVFGSLKCVHDYIQSYK